MQAQIFDEIGLAGLPKVLAMDILYSEKSDAAFDKDRNPIDRDDVLAQTIKRQGNALLPCSLALKEPPPVDPIQVELASMLTLDAELSYEQCVQKLKDRGFVTAGAIADAPEKFRRVPGSNVFKNSWRNGRGN